MSAHRWGSVGTGVQCAVCLKWADGDEEGACPGPMDPAKQRRAKLLVRIPPVVLAEIRAEAKRLDRSMTWVMSQAWKRARASFAAEASIDRS